MKKTRYFYQNDTLEIFFKRMLHDLNNVICVLQLEIGASENELLQKKILQVQQITHAMQFLFQAPHFPCHINEYLEKSLKIFAFQTVHIEKSLAYQGDALPIETSLIQAILVNLTARISSLNSIDPQPRNISVQTKNLTNGMQIVFSTNFNWLGDAKSWLTPVKNQIRKQNGLLETKNFKDHEKLIIFFSSASN